MQTSIVFQQFDRDYMINCKSALQNLCNVYCAIWERDEHFGEYRQCPSCQKYFSYDEVEVQGVVDCTQCGTQLVAAWVPIAVGLNLLEIADHHSFAGVILKHGESVVGFSWGRLYSVDELSTRLGSAYNVLHDLNPSALHGFYLEELGILPEYRGHGYGRKLVLEVLSQPFCRYPNVVGALSTHQDSPSVHIYSKLGYGKIADHPAGQGRIPYGYPKNR